MHVTQFLKISFRFDFLATTLKLTTSTDHSTFYFSDFVTEFYKIMLRLIDRNSKRVATSELSVLKYELQCHLWIMKAGLLFFNFNPTWNFSSLINPTSCILSNSSQALEGGGCVFCLPLLDQP